MDEIDKKHLPISVFDTPVNFLIVFHHLKKKLSSVFKHDYSLLYKSAELTMGIINVKTSNQ